MRQLAHHYDCDCRACYMWRYRHLEKTGHREKLNNHNARHQTSWRQRHPGTESLRKKAYKAADAVMDFLLEGATSGHITKIRTQFFNFVESHLRVLLRFFWEGLHNSMTSPLLCEPFMSMAFLHIPDADADIAYDVGFYSIQNHRTQLKRRLGILNQTNLCGHKGIHLTFPFLSTIPSEAPTLTIYFETELFLGHVCLRIIDQRTN
jgi:hypothetical protein